MFSRLLLAEHAAGLERLVDALVERGVIAGGVGVPDLVIARSGRLAQRLDLPERDFRERHGAFVFVGILGHRNPLGGHPVRKIFSRGSFGRVIHAKDRRGGI